MSEVFPLHRILEAILFASQKPASTKELLGILKGAADSAKEDPALQSKYSADEIAAAICTLEEEYRSAGRAFEVRESAAGWQLVTRAEFSPWLRQLFPENRPAKLSSPALETLAIIAYRQPITRADIEAVRGVAVDGVMQTLLDRGLVRIAGRADVPGRPLLYETTQFFMEHFGLKDLDELPNAGELRKIPLPQATPAPEPGPAPAPAGDELPLEAPPHPAEADASPSLPVEAAEAAEAAEAGEAGEASEPATEPVEDPR